MSVERVRKKKEEEKESVIKYVISQKEAKFQDPYNVYWENTEADMSTKGIYTLRKDYEIPNFFRRVKKRLRNFKLLS